MVHHLRAGHRLTLRVTTSDPGQGPDVRGQDVQVNVFSGGDANGVDVPVVRRPDALPGHGPVRTKDQAPVGPRRLRSGTVTTSGPGRPRASRTSPAQYLEFDVPAGVDDAKAVVDATVDAAGRRRPVPAAPAADGTWGRRSRVGASAETAGRADDDDAPPPGRYRIEVHNEDGEILEANQVIAYFQYANRTVTGLGVFHAGEMLGLAPSNAGEADWGHR